MTESLKQQQLNAHKRLATGLFLLMLGAYIIMAWLGHAHPAGWIGYIKAFSEAAMVGALADWFAITALFHHPMGIPIPHTNLIEKGKRSIGNNLGAFVVTNFLTSGTIRPYIDQLKISAYVANWLAREKNKELLIREVTTLGSDILEKMDDGQIAGFMARKGTELLSEIKLNVFVGNAAVYFLEQGEHQPLITVIAEKVKEYIRDNETLVREKVKGESYFFIPGFVEDKLASKITSGLVRYFEEIEKDPEHRVRTEISTQLLTLAKNLGTEEKWAHEFRQLGAKLLPAEKLEVYAAAAWQSLKNTLREELADQQSALGKYLSAMLDEQVRHLQTDLTLQDKIDGWIRHTAYKYILRNATQVGTLISDTVGNWQGRELSRKLELEVGKDLQFIRINGTIVGGLVGLLIYTFTELLT